MGLKVGVLFFVIAYGGPTILLYISAGGALLRTHMRGFKTASYRHRTQRFVNICFTKFITMDTAP